MATTFNKKLHVIACITDSYFDIYRDLFDKTLPLEFDSVILYHSRASKSLPGAVATPHFKKINYEKLHFIRSQMNAFKGDNLLVLDLDIVFFKNFKNHINHLLTQNDMVFQYDTSDNCIANVGVWAMQCSSKNMDFFDKEILPRSHALLLSQKQFNHMLGGKMWDITKDWKFAWAPRYSADILSSHNKNYEPVGAMAFDGDQCVVNAALLQPHYGHNLSINFLDKQCFSQVYNEENFSKNIALYHAVGAQGQEKYSHMEKVYFEIGDKLVGNSDWRKEDK